MICLRRIATNGDHPLLCYAGTSALVFVAMSHLLARGHFVDGVLITEPVKFPNFTVASAVGSVMRGATAVSEYDEVRNAGKLVALTPKAGVADVFPTPRATLIRNLTPAQVTDLRNAYAAAIAQVLP